MYNHRIILNIYVKLTGLKVSHFQLYNLCLERNVEWVSLSQ